MIINMTENSNIGKGTAEGALAYLDRIIEKGRGTPGAINPLKIAFEKVVSEVDGSSWKDTVVDEIDLEDYIARFGNLTRGKYTDKTLSVYKSRVNRVIGWYSKFMSKETPGYFPMLSTRKTADQQVGKRTADRKSSKANYGINTITEAEVIDRVMQTGLSQNHQLLNAPTPTWLQDSNGLIAFPFPLADGTVASLNLPKNLTIQDAKRMVAYINSLVLEGNE
jgi:hypothetical protein